MSRLKMFMIMKNWYYQIEIDDNYDDDDKSPPPRPTAFVSVPIWVAGCCWSWKRMLVIIIIIMGMINWEGLKYNLENRQMSEKLGEMLLLFILGRKNWATLLVGSVKRGGLLCQVNKQGYHHHHHHCHHHHHHWNLHHHHHHRHRHRHQW